MPDTIIISGDQTGTERAALDAVLDHKRHDLKIDGYFINQRKAEDGLLSTKYTLRNLNTDNYLERNQENFTLANKTLILTVSTIKFDTNTIPNLEEKEYKFIKLKETLNDNINHIDINSLIEWIKNDKIFITGPKQNNNNHVNIYDVDNAHVSWCKSCDPMNSIRTGNNLVDNFLQKALHSANQKREKELKVALKMLEESENISGREKDAKIRDEFRAADNMNSNPSSLQKHSDAIYTSRLLSQHLDLGNIPEPKNSIELTATPDSEYFILSDEESP
ncbi:3177_t:CDS:2, partial [Gigaspora margarita]